MHIERANVGFLFSLTSVLLEVVVCLFGLVFFSPVLLLFLLFSRISFFSILYSKQEYHSLENRC